MTLKEGLEQDESHLTPSHASLQARLWGLPHAFLGQQVFQFS